MIWQVGTFPFPDDDGAALRNIMDVMHRDEHWITDPDTRAYLVKVEDASAVVYLRMAVDPPYDAELGPDEVLVAVRDRSKCEQLLRENCLSSALWFSLVLVATSTRAELTKFTGLFDEQMGAKNSGHNR